MNIAQENDFIPFVTGDLPKGPYLVLAPHPDDETFGMGGTMLKAKEKEIPITVIFITDGALGGDVENRRKEALEATRLFALENALFFGFPDRELFRHGEEFKERLEEVFEAKRFATIFSPSLQEYHPDHRAVTIFLFDLLKGSHMSNKEIWLYEIIRQGDANRLIDISGHVEEKKQAMDLYGSQLEQNIYKDVVLGINRARAITIHHLGCDFAEGFLAGTSDEILREYERRFSLLGLRHGRY